MTQHPCTTKPNATYDPTQFPHQYSYYLSASPTYEPTILSTHTGPNSNKQSTPLLSQPSDAPLLHSSPASHFRRHPPTPSHLRRYPPIPPAPPSHSRCRSRLFRNHPSNMDLQGIDQLPVVVCFSLE
ncbi:unnamed protein product [Lactuca saligna]|uniref:Uncharacterized protein n=1 Tax=Lactuca saligna TaxID=75948 RepID=A0AA36EB08_LACSI|nr:unnamed protein product [Lactuca saligna]